MNTKIVNGLVQIRLFKKDLTPLTKTQEIILTVSRCVGDPKAREYANTALEAINGMLSKLELGDSPDLPGQKKLDLKPAPETIEQVS